jgi:hypothetical protein
LDITGAATIEPLPNNAAPISSGAGNAPVAD